MRKSLVYSIRFLTLSFSQFLSLSFSCMLYLPRISVCVCVQQLLYPHFSVIHSMLFCYFCVFGLNDRSGYVTSTVYKYVRCKKSHSNFCIRPIKCSGLFFEIMKIMILSTFNDFGVSYGTMWSIIDVTMETRKHLLPSTHLKTLALAYVHKLALNASHSTYTFFFVNEKQT